MSTAKGKVSESQSVGDDAEGQESGPAIAGAVSITKRVVGELMPARAPELDMLDEVKKQLGVAAGTVIDNFPKDEISRWKLDNAATTGASIPIVEIIGQVIQPQYWRIEPVELENEANGELAMVPRVVIWDHSGKVYHATSFGVFAVVASFVRAFGTKPIEKGVKLKVAEITTRKRRRMLTLQAV